MVSFAPNDPAYTPRREYEKYIYRQRMIELIDWPKTAEEITANHNFKRKRDYKGGLLELLMVLFMCIICPPMVFAFPFMLFLRWCGFESDCSGPPMSKRQHDLIIEYEQREEERQRPKPNTLVASSQRDNWLED